MPDTWLRTDDRDDGTLVQTHPDDEVHGDWVGVTPVIVIPAPSVTTDQDGNISVKDTRPEPMTVATNDDGSVVITVPNK